MKKYLVHLFLGVFWILMAIPTITIWQDSILLVLLMSLYANIESSFGAYEAAKQTKNKKKNNKFWKSSSVSM